MDSPFLALPHAEILARLTSLVTAAAGAPLVVRVGAESAAGHRNVGVDLPRAKTKHEGTLLRLRVREALEGAGVTMAENAIAPKVGGSMLGQIQTTAHSASMAGDASHLNPGSRGGG